MPGKSLLTIILAAVFIFLSGCATTVPVDIEPIKTARVKTGIEVLKQNNFELLAGKRVGLVTNATGVDWQLHSTVDLLYEAPNVELVALYGPEHGTGIIRIRPTCLKRW